MTAALTMADLEIRDSLVVNLSRQQQLEGIVSEERAIRELDDRKAVIEHFKRRFLSFAVQDMTDDQDGLPLAFGPQVLQGTLRDCGARKGPCLAACIGSDNRHEYRNMSVTNRVRDLTQMKN